MDKQELREQLGQGLADMEIALEEVAREKLLDFCNLVREANERMNLTAIADPAEMIPRHILDSLAPLSVPTLAERLRAPGATLIDIGTGAGFPGVPLAIALPDLRVTLLDSLQKRISFLEETTEALGLSNVSLLAARAEDAARDPLYREQFDLATSRAVADMSPLLECSLPFLRKDGAFIAYKGAEIDEELGRATTAIEILGGVAEEPLRYSIPNTNITHALLPIIKSAPTPEKYPRRAGIPTKRPL